MKIVVYSENDCYNLAKEGKISDSKYAVISIRDIDKKPISSFESFKNVEAVLKLNFNDSIEDDGMTAFDAKLVRKFIDSIKDKVDVIAIHCFMGQSRSYTIGVVLNTVLPGILIIRNKNTRINSLVYSRMTEAFRDLLR